MKGFLRDNDLTIVLVTMFLLSVVGMIWSGHSAYDGRLRNHGEAAMAGWSLQEANHRDGLGTLRASRRLC